MSTLRLLPKIVVAVLFFPLAAISACTVEVRNYGGGGSASTGDSSSSSSTSGGMQCTSDADCGASSECQSFVCANGSCTVMFAPMGTVVSGQAIGDCQSNICDGKGYVVSIPDTLDPIDDGNPCTLDACIGKETQHANHPAGKSCNGSQFCDGAGQCVECLSGMDCASGVCSQNTCTIPKCSDMAKNGQETDIDCGGPDCPKCPEGFGCLNPLDCKSNVCTSNKCVMATCTDGIQNGSETDVDCGGPTCIGCPAGKPCNAGVDCSSGVCAAGVCQAVSCTDQTQNGNESDVDCGGGVCPKCPLGQGCFKNTDCMSSHCCPSGDPMIPGYCDTLSSMCVAVLRSEITQ